MDEDEEDPQGNLFGFKPEKANEILLKPLRHRIWTENKAKLVERYLHYFLFITKHGTYIDGFAGAQYPEQAECWAAQAVLTMEPRWLRNFFLCEIDSAKVQALEALVDAQPPRDKSRREPKRAVKVIPGDFNASVADVLGSGVITEREAAFCLLDQRTFECHWQTVKSLAQHKTSGNKIELFYFLAIKWLHRAMAENEDVAAITHWWGDATWLKLRDASTQSICDAVRDRFKEELGYKYVYAWPIFEQEHGGAVMYYMIHASDHPEAPILMRRAYQNALKAPEPLEQLQLDIATGNYLGEDS